MQKTRSFEKKIAILAFLFLSISAALNVSSALDQLPYTKLQASLSGNPTQSMGFSVAVDGNTMVVGAPSSSPFGNVGGGTARIYKKDGMGKWIFQAELSGGSVNFGYAVSISGNRIVVGAPRLAPPNSSYGTVHVFVYNGLTWDPEITFDGEGDFDNQFGSSVSISGNILAVGVPNYLNFGKRTGAIFVYDRFETFWHKTYRCIVAPDGAEGDRFGESLASDGETIFIGAPHADLGTTVDTGAVYVYSGKDLYSLAQQAKLYAANTTTGDLFGCSVSLSGDTAVIGSLSACKAYVFTCSDSNWSQQSVLTAPDAAQDRLSEIKVSVSGDTAVIGAPNNDSALENTGFAFVFKRAGSTWTEQTKIAASDAAAGDNFGSCVAVSGETIAVGAYQDDVGVLTDCGSIYAFTQNGAAWTETDKLIGPVETVDLYKKFGNSVAISGDTAVVGTNDTTYPGTVYLYMRSGNQWRLHQVLIASDAEAGDCFGQTVAIQGDTIIIGAPGKDGASFNSGGVYVFTRSGDIWTQKAILMPSTPHRDGYFGNSLSLSGDTVVIGIKGSTSLYGEAFIFTGSESTWTEQQKLTASDHAYGDSFGFSVSVSNDTAVIGSLGAGQNPMGAAYIFTRTGSTWAQQQKLIASDAAANDLFGYSTAISGDTVLVGAYRGEAAYVFNNNGIEWTQQQKLVAPDNWASAFGFSVSLSDDQAVIGAPDSWDYEGVAYVFKCNNSVWEYQKTLVTHYSTWGDGFGQRVAIDAGRVVVGVFYEDNIKVDMGAAYVFAVLPPDGTPTSLTAKSVSTDSITVRWKDTSTNEGGFKIYSDPGTDAPVDLVFTADNDAETWTYSGLGPNQQYSFNVAATNIFGDSEKANTLTTWTLAAIPLAPTVSNPTLTTLDVTLGAGDSNPAITQYAIQISPAIGGNEWVQADGSLGQNAVWQTTAEWGTKSITGLSDDTVYTFAAKARNGAGIETAMSAGGNAHTTALFQVTFQTDGTSGATLTGVLSQEKASGEDCTAVTAHAPAGYLFVGWTKGGVDYSTSNPLTVTNVTEDLNLIATFIAAKPASAKEWTLYE